MLEVAIGFNVLKINSNNSSSCYNKNCMLNIVLLVVIFILSSTSLPSFSKEDLQGPLFNYQQGANAHKNGDLENAEFFFKNCLNINSGHVPSLIELGEVYIEKGKYQDAISSLTKALNISPNDALIHVLLGTAYQENKKYDNAIYHYNQAIKVEPENTLVRVNLGLVCSLKNDNECAIDNLGKVVLAYPYQLRARAVLGTAYHTSMDYGLARDQYKSVLEHDPTNLSIWYNLAKTQIALSDFEHARESLDKAISLDGSILDLYLDRADVNYKLNKLEDAQKDYLKALSLDSSNPESSIEFGTFLWKTSAYSKAAEQFGNAYKLQPDDKTLIVNKAYLLQLAKEDENSLSTWKEVLKNDPTNNFALFNLGKLHQDKNDYDNAIPYYKKLIAQKGLSSENLQEAELALAYCYQKMKNYSEAKIAYDKVLSEKPNDPMIQYNLAVLLIEDKKYKDAIPYLEGAIKNNFSPSKNAYQALAEIYSNLNDALNLKIAYKNWLEVDKDNVESRIAFAKFLAKTGDSLGAIEQYRVAAALDNTSKSRYKLAQFLLEQKDLYGAVGQFQEYLKTEPNDTDALILLANCFRDLHVNEQAQDTYKKIISIQPENHLAYYNLGLIYQEDKKQEEAINYFLKTLEIDDKYAPSYYALGLSYLMNNEKDKAKESLEKYLLVEPVGEYKEKAELKIKEILTPTPSPIPAPSSSPVVPKQQQQPVKPVAVKSGKEKA